MSKALNVEIDTNSKRKVQKMKFVFKNRNLILCFFLLVLAQMLLSQNSPYEDQDCLSCHGKPELSQITPDGNIRSLYIIEEIWTTDVHHNAAMSCVDCHRFASPYLHFREGYIDVDCARCHPEEAEEYHKNIHFEFSPVTPGKELPQCFHCHTKHAVLRHDHPSSSIHEKNLAETCGECHVEIMIGGILNGASLGKVSGHRKGDASEKFDMKVCINCHYEDAAHGAKRAYKEFCVKCHNVDSAANPLSGPTHLDSLKWKSTNRVSGGLLLLLIIGLCAYRGYAWREKIPNRFNNWLDRMKVKKPDREIEDEPQPKNENGEEGN